MSPPRRPDRPATRRDLEALPENVVGEILAGELHASPRPAGPHANASSALGSEICHRFHRPGGGDGAGGWWILDEPELELGEDILVPDLAGWRRERLPALPHSGPFTLAPDWICEVLSPSTARIDRLKKLPIYYRAGVSHVWLVDPSARLIEVWRRGAQHWESIGVVGDARGRIEPFESLELELERLWDCGAPST